MKNKSLKYILVFILSFFLPIRLVKANIVPLGPSEYALLFLPIIPLFYLITVAIEFVIYYTALDKFRFEARDILRPIAFANLITNPIAQIFSILFMVLFPNYLFYFILIIEVIVIIIESLLLFDIFTRKVELSKKRFRYIVFIANLFSMLIGILPYLVTVNWV